MGRINMGETLLRSYLDEVGQYYQKGTVTEHTYRGTLQNLLEKLATGIRAINEPKRTTCGAPDYVVERNNLTIGYVEAKDVGISLDKVEKDEQLKRYLRALDNLILTDYLEFRWYVQGEKRMAARIGSIRNKRITLEKEGGKLGEELLHSFLEHRGEPIRKPQELAKRMARLAHFIHDIIVDAFREELVSDTIQDLYTVFQDLLLPDLTESAFADMFAQTIAYGLFAARYNHKGNTPFRREDAAKEIPRTNPFLRKLFSTIAGPDLDDEPFVGFVDELAQVLALTDMEAVLADFGKRTKQEDPIVHFYETFLAQYDPKLRELRGVYYTPEPVVSYIVRSVDHLLRENFHCPDGLADTATTSYNTVDEDGKEHIERKPRVLILDPATGTGTFLYNVIEHIRETYRQMNNAGMWSGYVREHLLPRLFGFELLIAPYAMAHLKLSMQLAALDLPEPERKIWAYDFKTDERLGIYLTNTLDEALKRSEVIFGRYISDEANEAAKVKQGYPVMVVLGNPPYSGHSANKGQWINDLLRGKDSQTGRLTGNYFEVDGQPLGERNPKWLNDDYVKFIRLAQWRIEKTGYGILAFITNHGYLDNPTFRGMRQSLMQTFDDMYILDLHGNSKKKERSPDGSKDENVFDIQQGVAIGIFVKRQKKAHLSRVANVYHAHLWGQREIYEKVGHKQRLVGGKYHWLSEHDILHTEWAKIEPKSPFYLFTPRNTEILAEYEKGWKLTEIITLNVLGFQTHRDHFAVAYNKEEIYKRIEDMRNQLLSDEELLAKHKLKSGASWDIGKARKKLKADNAWEQHILICTYHPFDRRYCYFNDAVMDRPRRELTEHVAHKENLCILSSRQQATLGYRHCWVTRDVANDCVISTTSREANQVFPLYLYPTKNKGLFDTDEVSNTPSGRRPNLSPAFIKEFSGNLNMRFIPDGKGNLQQNFGPEDIFSYMYAIFHAPTYRERYTEFLKADFPRLPLTSNPDLFRKLCSLGNRLVELHLMEKTGKITTRYPESGDNIIEKVDFTSPADAPEQSRVWINKTQYIEGVLPKVWEFHVGGYQVCQKWLKDRKGLRLSFEDIRHYQRIVAALAETITLMEQIDEAIDAYGGWPIT
jgi:predicted helicase